MERLVPSKKALAVGLSRLSTFRRADVRLEQYPTPGDIAADVLWDAYMQGNVSGKVIADLGCGSGILGMGALLLGAKKVYFVDVDPEAVSLAEKQYETVKSEDMDAEFICSDIADFRADDVDVVIQNPPFGTKEKHADKAFLEKAFSLAPLIYSFHKAETISFLEAIARDEGYAILRRFQFAFPLKKTMEHHKKKVHHIDVVCFVFSKL